MFNNNTGDGWQPCPVNFRGLVGNVTISGNVLKFSLDSQDIDKDRIQPVIWSHQSQLREYANDNGFRYLPIVVKGIRRRFLERIEER